MLQQIQALDVCAGIVWGMEKIKNGIKDNLLQNNS